MSNIFVFSGSQPYSFAPGRLNVTFAERARTRLEAAGHTVPPVPDGQRL